MGKQTQKKAGPPMRTTILRRTVEQSLILTTLTAVILSLSAYYTTTNLIEQRVFAQLSSLVGPRPHLPDEVDRYSSYERRVFAVKPGITGLAQVSGRSDLVFKEEVRLDLKYIEEWSLFLDLWILWRTIFAVLRKNGAD